MEHSPKAAGEFVWPGRVTQVIDPQYFWMQLGTKENLFQFDQLQNDLQKFARQSWAPVSSVEELEPGMVVLVDTNTESQVRWKRGQIAGIMHGDSVDVFYVDYGNTELTTVDRICCNLPTQFKACPPQAVRCSLAGVKPLVKKWTSRGIKTFQHLTSNTVFNVLVLYGEPGYCEVALYPSDEDGRSIGHCLVTEEVAMMAEEQMIPEFLQDIPMVMTQGQQNMSPGNDSSSQTQTDDQHPDVDTKVQLTPPSAEKYIPPHQKGQGSPSGSTGSSLNSHGTSHHSSPNSSSTNKYSSPRANSSSAQVSNNKKKEPVNDFFPFDNVSVYPPSPSSPQKSPGRGQGYDSSSEGQSSYFSRSPKNNQYGPRSNTSYKYREDERYTPGDVGYNQQHYHSRHEKSRFAANFDNLPQPANTFEPSYLNHQRDRGMEKVTYTNSSPVKSESGLHGSPNKSFSDSDQSPRARPKLKIPGPHSKETPFYPPDQRGEGTGGYAASKMWNPAPAQVYEQSHPSYGLHPPAFYQSNIPPPTMNQSQQYFNNAGPPVSPVKHYPHSGSEGNSPVKPVHYNNTAARGRGQNINSVYQDQYYKSYNQNSSHSIGSPSSSYNQFYDTNNSSIHHQTSKSSIKTPSPTTPSKYYGYEQPRVTPESPDSPAIAGFNFGDLEHTQMTSADHFHQQNHQERLQALQEEAEDIARESKEQSELVSYCRYGSRGHREDVSDYAPVTNQYDVFDQIAQEIHNTSLHNSKDPVEYKRSPVKTAGRATDVESSVKLDGIPKSYISDINFAEAVREALESGKNDMDNARSLLRDIVESLRSPEAESQLYDVVMVMLSKAVKEFELFHTVVMETIVALSGEVDIKDCLSKALRRQQELCVRVPTPRKPQHIDFAKVMGQIYNIALDLSDSNANIQDNILVTIEKWIVFNSKGKQIGQEDKENVFLDCFDAFWEVSCDTIIQHNPTFRSRIQNEIRQKLLTEGVSRSVRERLLDMTVEMFSQNVEKQDASTQTKRRTMIPSSCQVRPSTCDKATFMESEWQDDGFTNLDPEKLSMNWQAPVGTDYASADPVLNLRPLGRGFTSVQKQPTVGDSPSGSKPNNSFGTPTGQDISRTSEFNESVYVTPNESFVSDSGRDKTRFSDAVNENTDRTPNAVSFAGKSKTSSVQNVATDNFQSDIRSNESKGGKSSDAAILDEKNVNQNACKIDRTVSQQKSASGKSLVDWFDYEPSASDSAKCVNLEEKLLEAKKKLDSTSREIIENDVALKYAPTKDVSKRKVKKDKERKSKKNASSILEERKSESNKVDSDSKDLTAECAYEREIQQAIIESLKPENISSRDVSDGVVSNSESVKDDIDWWGVGEPAEPRYFPDSVSDARADNIHIDNGPDVIIEDEFEQTDFESDWNKTDQSKFGLNEAHSNALGANNDQGRQIDKESSKPMSGEIQGVANENGSDPDEETGIAGHDILVPRKNDDFNFDLDDSEDDDDNWDSNTSDDLNVNDWVGLQEGNPSYAEAFPQTDLKTVLAQKTNLTGNEVNNEPVSDTNYDRNYPVSNLGDFVKVKEEFEEKPRSSRWVPGKRKCLNCYSEDHTTERCDKFVLLQ